MADIIQIIHNKPSALEKFGLYYLGFFKRIDFTHSVFDLTDADLTDRVNKITKKGIFFSALIGILCVFTTVWVDVYFTKSTFIIHYGFVIIATVAATTIEFYVLFIIALKAVYAVSEIINMHASQSELAIDGLFSVQHILSRTALELPDPELEILGIDPFKRISKKNLFILGLLYKAKILVTNFVLKYMLLITIGPSIWGISILYEALLVECFWNSVVIRRVVHEARLRLFGFALANQIAGNVNNTTLINQLSPIAKEGCLRAIGNAVVMSKNYHPNMIILLIRFQQILQITTENKYDDWTLFLDTLRSVTEGERYFLLDLFTVAAAFDGKLSFLETESLKDAYGKEYEQYYPRLLLLTKQLKNGELNAALDLCNLNFLPG